MFSNFSPSVQLVRTHSFNQLLMIKLQSTNLPIKTNQALNRNKQRFQNIKLWTLIYFSIILVLPVIYQIIIRSTMPRVNSQRQKNKPFKAKSKASATRNKNKASTKTKSIAKPKGRTRNTKLKLIQQKKEKKVCNVERVSNKNEYLDQNTKSLVISQLKSEANLKIVVLFPGNKQANTNQLIQSIYKSCEKSVGITLKTDFKGIPYPTLQIIPNGKAFIKNKIMIISSQRINREGEMMSRDLQSLMDLIKCSDIICPVLSCKHTDIQGMSLDPHQKGGAFDELGYAIVNMIRSLGAPTTIGVVQDLHLHQQRHHDKIERLFKRFISSELNENDKINYLKGNQHQINKLIRQIDSTTAIEQPWKTQRGYVLVEDITTDESSGNLTFHGILKGNSVYANQLVHVVGFDEYEVQKIQIKPTRHQNSNSMSEQIGKTLIQHSTMPESLYPFSKAQQLSEDILSGFNKLQVSERKQSIANQMGEQNSGEFEDQSDIEQDDQDIDNYFQNNKQQEKTKRIEMQMRKQDQLQFEDEIEYAAEEILREKFREYQGIKSFKTSQWNQLENLPDEYDRIYTFKHYNRTHQSVLSENQSKSFAYPNFYISVTLKNFPKERLLQNSQVYPTIIVFLLKHERKMTQMHLKVRRNPYYQSNQTVIQSNQQYSISLGFRRFTVRPIFSRVVSGTQKTKYTKKIGEDYQNYFFCSFYYYNYFPPAPVQIYRVNQLNLADRQASPIMYGTLAKCDPLHIILQRIILTGYPFKINKRRSTVRFMFFNPKDVKYFKPVEVRTKMGLKGRIEQSLGTHGYMKVLFNDKVKHNDTVCMHLYRRVYPQPTF